MKYMLLIYENPGTREAFFADEKLRAEMNAYVDGLRESGEYVGGEGLADPSTARVVRIQERRSRGHRRPVHGGQGVLRRLHDHRLRQHRARDRDRALFPPSPVGGAMEIRPLMDGGGSED